ncbi:MAG TPA: hypothetical protein VJ824_07425 [Bacillota bacterium]|nr:hypothetical protein [Bacillota bacterium]
MSKSLEEHIVSELRRHHTNTLHAKLTFFREICTRLGLEEEGFIEIKPTVEQLLRDELHSNNIH